MMDALVVDLRATLFAAPARIAGFPSEVPVAAALSGGKPSIHRFYDTSPISPSGRFLAVTELPYDDRLPTPGDEARVVVVDLQSGEEVFSTATAAWDTQVGAHAQWGRSDGELYFNRLSTQTWEAHGVQADIGTGRERSLAGTVYMVSPDGLRIASPSLHKIAMVQAGYGLNLPQASLIRNHGAPADDGLFVTDAGSGQTELLLSLERVSELLAAEGVAPDLFRGGLYGFHVKWNKQGTRLMFLVRWLPENAFQKRTLNYLITVRSDGTEPKLALDAQRWSGGHHPNWWPDGERIVMNLREQSASATMVRFERIIEKFARRLGLRYHPKANPMRFYSFRCDGSSMQKLAPSRLGSGHPTIDPSGGYILTDAYLGEPVASSDTSVPLRWIDLRTGEERTLADVPVKPAFAGPQQELRVDPHPAWHMHAPIVAFNGYVDGVRQVYVADLSRLSGAAAS